MRAAGSWVEWPAGDSRPDVADTKMSGRILSCIPASYFGSFQPFLSREVSHPNALSSSPHPLHTFLCTPTLSITAHTARPTCMALRCCQLR